MIMIKKKFTEEEAFKMFNDFMLDVSEYVGTLGNEDIIQIIQQAFDEYLNNNDRREKLGD